MHTIVVGPEDPDPFTSDWARPRRSEHGSYYIERLDPRYPFPRSELMKIENVSLAAVAFIPPGYLRSVYAAFADDGVSSQPAWLSEAFVANKYRFAHGLRLRSERWKSWAHAANEATVFAKANPTTIRHVAWPRFPAPIEIAKPAALTPPPTRRPGDLYVVGSHARSRNGFLSTQVGRWTAELRGVRNEDIPQIGISLQIWRAEDECKCVAVAHNFFPKYDVYIDGWRFGLPDDPSFVEFDAYRLDVEWRTFLAMRLYDTLQPFPLVQRYPGSCLTGWYKKLDDSGRVVWCDQEAPPIHIEYPAPPSREHIVAWWKNLEAFVERYAELAKPSSKERTHDRDTRRQISYDEKLASLWRGIVAGARMKMPRDAG